MSIHTATPSDRAIFKSETEDFIRYAPNPEQLTRAIVAHRAFLAWEAEPTAKNWAKFNTCFRTIES